MKKILFFFLMFFISCSHEEIINKNVHPAVYLADTFVLPNEPSPAHQKTKESVVPFYYKQCESTRIPSYYSGSSFDCTDK